MSLGYTPNHLAVMMAVIIITVCLSKNNTIHIAAFTASKTSARIAPFYRHRYQCSRLKLPETKAHLNASKSEHDASLQSPEGTTSLQERLYRNLLNIRSKIISVATDKKQLTRRKRRRRWEMRLTSKPFQEVDSCQSTIKNCMMALAVYFVIGTCILPFLEPSWTLIDALYFSVTTLTTVGYGDLLLGGGASLRGTFGKLFLLSFNIYAVCISVSALGIIAKLALAQEKKIIKQARQQAKAKLLNFFKEEDEEEGSEVGEDDGGKSEDTTWADNLFLDKYDEDEEPQTMMGVLWKALRAHSFNFVALVGLASILGKVEKWSFVDVIYFWNCTATTMGFGDISPQTQFGRLIAVVFIPLSVVSLGEVIASCVAHLNARASAKAEKDFLRREITFDDLELLDVNDDGKVCQLDFITFMLVAMKKVDGKSIKDLTSIFKALDTGSNGYIEKEDLIMLRQRKRLAKRLRREARKRKKLYERGYPKIDRGNAQTAKQYDQLKAYRIN